MIRFESVDLSVAGRPLLTGVDWHLRPGSRVGLVGPNGSGKTTLLRAILGEIAPDAGRIHRRGRTVVAWLPQHAVAGSSRTVWEEVRTGMVRLIPLREAYEAAEAAVTAGASDAASLERLDRATEALRQAGGFAEEATIGQVLAGLGFAPADWHRPCDTFSGGWQVRIALARLLLSAPDVALLDEPTNHLDLHARAWLADHLAASRGAVVIVSHDRYLLDRVAQRIVAIRRGRVREWTGNVSAYLRQRAREEAGQRAAHAARQAERARLERFVERFGAKATKAAQARSKQRALDRMAPVEAPLADGPRARLRLPDPPPVGHEVLGLDQAVLGWPGQPPLCAGIQLRLDRGMRLALLGPNGCGKSTLLKVLAGRLPPLSGRLRRDDRARIGVFSQDLAADLPGERTPLAYVHALVPTAPVQTVRATLGALGLGGEDALRPIATLSGGERARVALAALAIRPHNALLLDEPSNHLDIETVEVLAQALSGWSGTVLLVSHDRALVERVATHVAHLGREGLRVREGVRPEDFRPAVLERAPPDKAGGGAQAWAERKARAARRRRAERQIADLQARIEQAEARVEDLDRQLYAEAADHRRARELAAARDAAQAEVDRLYAAWERAEAALAE